MANNFQVEENDSPKKEKKKGGLFTKIAFLVLIAILFFSLFGIYLAVRGDGAEVSNGGDVNETNTPPPTKTETSALESENSGLRVIIMVIVICVVAVVAYVLLTKNDNTGLNTKKPIAPDRALELFKHHLCEHEGIKGWYDREKEVYVPSYEQAIVIGDRLPFFHQATGDNFLMIEVEVNEGTKKGIHTAILPIDKGEEPIRGGYYRLDTHTLRSNFQLHRINYPMSSLQDKTDRLNMALLDRMDGDQNQEVINKMIQKTPTITTPLDAQQEQPTGQTTAGNAPSTVRYVPRRRSRYYRRRY